jgi:hypothetical protein
MIGALYISGKIYFSLLMYTKTREEKKLTSYIVLLSHQPTSTADSAIRAGLAVLVGWCFKRTM